MKQLVFSGKRFQVFTEEVYAPIPHTKEFINHSGAVVILPFVNQEEILLIKNYRFVVGETLWEIPAGTLELNEDPLKAAKRELEEETGYTSAKIEPLLSFFASPGISNEVMHIYTAFDLSYVGQNLDATEKIEVVRIKWNEALAMIKSGEIHDGKTIAALLFYLSFTEHDAKSGF